MQFNAAVTNAVSTGLISARDAIIRFNGGLTNNGSLAVTVGTADIFSDIVNSATGQRPPRRSPGPVPPAASSARWP
jgi:hypothetical protein